MSSSAYFTKEALAGVGCVVRESLLEAVSRQLHVLGRNQHLVSGHAVNASVLKFFPSWTRTGKAQAQPECVVLAALRQLLLCVIWS